MSLKKHSFFRHLLNNSKKKNRIMDWKLLKTHLFPQKFFYHTQKLLKTHLFPQKFFYHTQKLLKTHLFPPKIFLSYTKTSQNTSFPPKIFLSYTKTQRKINKNFSKHIFPSKNFFIITLLNTSQ
jgi:hypothetical protein